MYLRSLVRAFVRLSGLFLVFGFVLTVMVQAASVKSPWLGVWSAKLGDYGIVALSIGDKGDGVPARVAVWWLVDQPRVTDLRIDGDTLFIDILDHQRSSAPGIALRITDRKTLRFADYGVLPGPLPQLYATVEFTKLEDDHQWYRIADSNDKASEWAKWRESSQLKPLPSTWPADIASPLLRLFAHSDHLLHEVVVLPSLSEADLAAAYAWTKDKNSWSENMQRRIGRNPNVPASVLMELWSHPDNSRFWIAAAQNPKAPSDWRTALTDRILNAPDDVQDRAIRHGDGPPELYLRIIETIPRLRRLIAQAPQVPAVVYETLARDYPQDSINTLCLNPAVPVALLEGMAAFVDQDGQRCLIHNSALPAATRTRLVHQIIAQAAPADFTRFASDRDATTDFLTLCATDIEPSIRYNVAQNSNSPESLLLTLAEDPSRHVAEVARASLKAHFPSAFAQHLPNFTPLNFRPTEVPLQKQFADAATASDFVTLRRLAAYFAEREILDSMLGQSVRAVVQDAYRPAVMDFFIELGFGRRGTDLAQLAGRCGGNPEWIAYFRNHDAFAKNQAALAYRAALESKDAANLAGLLAAGIDPNQIDYYGLTALHIAVSLYNPAAVRALLAHGADRAARDRRDQTPLDYAVALRSIDAIRLLDADGKQTAFIAAFEKEFPPAPKSRFLGFWNNGEGACNVETILLNPDGSGRLRGDMIGYAILGWREISPTEALVYRIGEKLEMDRPSPIGLTLDAEGKTLTFTLNNGRMWRLIRP